MPLYPLFILLMAIGLRDEYTITANAIIGLLFWSPGWRHPHHDLQIIVLAWLVLFIGPAYSTWRQDFRFNPPEFIVNAGLSLRAWLESRISTLASGSLESFLRAVLLGDEEGLSKEMLDAFGTLGIRHMLAVSGFHVGIWTGMILPLSRIHKHRYWQLFINVVLIGFLIFYASAVGGSPSVIRAVGSFTLARFALLNGTKVAPIHWPMVMGIICFLVEPELISNIGFQLSYLAVFAILFVLRNSVWSDFLHHYALVDHPKTPFWLVTIQISIAAWIGTLPLVVYYFGFASPYFLLGNLFVVPVYTVFIWSALVMICLGPIVPQELVDFWNYSFEWWNNLVLHYSALLIH